MLDDNEKMIGSVMILQFENDEKMQEWYDNEPYIKDGVWKYYDEEGSLSITVTYRDGIEVQYNTVKITPELTPSEK
jgi:antitoxin component YwqK of YwqJK toxin-antitoxin module